MVALSRRLLLALAAALLLAPGVRPALADAPPAGYSEAPMLAAEVAKGALPPVAERLPQHPEVADMSWPGQRPGVYGGELHTLMGSTKDTRMMVVYGYARLVGYDSKYELVPDLLESFEVEDQKVFTFHLRPGHKWSDGSPFTTEDFRYYWEDVANNEDLSPSGPPHELMVDGKPPKVEILDATTIRYSWPAPNPDFLPALAGPSPLYIYRPSRYLKQFNPKYTDPAKVDAVVKQMGMRGWAPLHNKLDNMYRNDNPDLPSLEPWVLKTRPPSERFVFVRNPYYHRVDAAGRQLPYIDKVVLQIADSKIIPAMTGAGESELQARYLRFDNYTFLKKGEARSNYRVLLWDSGTGSNLALYPNLNASDKVWRDLLRDVRFRRALSLAIDRHEINQVIYYGLGKEGANTVLPASPLFKPEYPKAWSTFDLAQANRLLDEIGLTERDSDGIRKLPDGRTLEIVVETAGQSPEEGDVLELISDSWRQIGVKLFQKASERDYMRNRIFSGATIMSVWTGLEDGIPTAAFSPQELAPTTQQQLQWPKWGQYVETAGESGEAADLPEAKQLSQLLEKWRETTNREEQKQIWAEMLALWGEQVYTLGTVAGAPLPVVVDKRLRNVPDQAVFSWDPGAHFGIYHPDTFWFDGGATAQAQ
jgi:peptide/nickel transport system substrate-binding protein